MKRTVLMTCLLMAIAISTSGCFFTKIATVPMRVVGVVVSIVSVVGNTAHDTIDATAEVIDDLLF